MKLFQILFYLAFADFYSVKAFSYLSLTSCWYLVPEFFFHKVLKLSLYILTSSCLSTGNLFIFVNFLCNHFPQCIFYCSNISTDNSTRLFLSSSSMNNSNLKGREERKINNTWKLRVKMLVGIPVCYVLPFAYYSA